MEFKTVAAMAMWLRDAMLEEQSTKMHTQAALRAFSNAVSAVSLIAHNDGKINGKNAELRKLQLEAIIHEDGVCEALRSTSNRAEADLALATVERIYRQEHIKLTRAWLYEQAGTVITL